MGWTEQEFLDQRWDFIAAIRKTKEIEAREIKRKQQRRYG